MPAARQENLHTESCIDYAFSLAVENHRDATGEDLYALPFEDYMDEGIRTFALVQAELQEEGRGYLRDGLLECSCDSDAAWYAEHGKPYHRIAI